MNSKNTKRALFSSVIALILCFSMMLGTTFAWFTDSVTSANNIIKAGNLDVDVVDPNGDSIQNKPALFDGILWEPGVVAYENLTVKNLGTLALKYAMYINFQDANFVIDENGNETPYSLDDVLKAVILDENVSFTDRGELLKHIKDEGLEWKYLQEMVEEGELFPKGNADGKADAQEYAVVIYWEPSDEDNNWNVQNGKSVSDFAVTGEKWLHITLGMNLVATQHTYEEDSFDEKYDAQAAGAGFGSVTFGVNESAKEVHARNSKGTKVGSVVVNRESLADPTKPVEVNFTPSDYKGNFTVETGMETLVYDINVTNLKAGNTVPVEAYFRLPAGMDPATVKLYHNDELVTGINYDPTSGYVTFETFGFSPFTAVFDAESVYVPTTPDSSDLPVANVERSSEYENTELPWGSYGAWSPTEGLDANLEAAYTFACVDTLEEAQASPYANWYCDFVVMLDKDLGANQIFLGGNYGAFGWVGFHNGDLTLAANTEIPLLGSVTTNPWTYAQVVQSVGTFICGVGDVDDALSGATFTVMLRLTNPEDATEFYNVATINHTFE